LSSSQIPSEEEITEGLEQAVADGHAERVGTDAAGEPQYRLTPAGMRHVEEQLLPEVIAAARRERYDDVSLLPPAIGSAAITERGRLALQLPEERYVSDNVTLYPSAEGDAIGVAFAGDPAGMTWLERDQALALARGILARLEPAALVPRTFPPGAIPGDVSREELVLMARELVDEQRPTSRRHRLERFAHGTLEGLNSTLEGLGYREATLDELL
jgi:hypothetical protein